MRVVFFGTPAIAVPFLSALLTAEDMTVVGLVCAPDAPQGRHQVMTPPATATLFAGRGPIFQPVSVRKDLQIAQQLADLRADVFVVVAYGKILPEEILAIPTLGCINVHPSLLPRWRGPSPLQATILGGDTEGGVTIMQMDAAMDHGPILAQERFTLDSEETLPSLTQRAVAVGVPLLLSVLRGVVDGSIILQEQDHAAATVCGFLKKEDGNVNWDESAELLARKVRAYTPWPGMRSNDVKILRCRVSDRPQRAPGQVVVEESQLFVGTGTAPLELLDVQPAGSKPMSAAAFLNGHPGLDGAQWKETPPRAEM